MPLAIPEHFASVDRGVSEERSFLYRLINELDKYVIDELTAEIGFARGALKLHRAGFQLIGHLTCSSHDELRNAIGIGPKTIKKIECSLQHRGLSLGMRNRVWIEHRRHLAKHTFQ
jgi:hypothetical protein